MKGGLQSSAAEFVPADIKLGDSPVSSKASPSLASSLSATPFVPSVSSAVNSPLVLNAPIFIPGRAVVRRFSMMDLIHMYALNRVLPYLQAETPTNPWHLR